MSADFLEKMYRLSRRRAASMTPPPTLEPSRRHFGAALDTGGMAVIAEVKYATPAAGVLGIKEDPATMAREYERLGASAISCLTEPEFFAGRMEHLGVVRSACTLPVLMKDFIVDERQILAGRAHGADAFLLITEMLGLRELKALQACGRDMGMDCLVEVHGYGGLDKALAIDAKIIGVNSRDLRTLQVDAGRHEDLAGHIPGGKVRVAESGITSGTRLRELAALGYGAVLIGRAFAGKGQREEIFHVGQDLRHRQA
ncbi:MAG: indole-3-glycerol-phosphate synthase [Desulfobacterota bacterium]|nr:indole-3-glycerol-phosphate synthase [Thermodesulfobacteriota bacterium]